MPLREGMKAQPTKHSSAKFNVLEVVLIGGLLENQIAVWI